MCNIIYFTLNLFLLYYIYISFGKIFFKKECVTIPLHFFNTIRTIVNGVFNQK
jgi:hypothetical protein